MSTKALIPGVKLIRHNASRIDGPDDPSFPFKLEVSLRPPEFMAIAFMGLYGGSEEIVIRAMTKEGIEECIVRNEMRTHPRLRHLIITGPNGELEKIEHV